VSLVSKVDVVVQQTIVVKTVTGTYSVVIVEDEANGDVTESKTMMIIQNIVN
jgi:hypothetical protein